MYQIVTLCSLSIDQTLGQRLPGITEPLGKTMCCGIKIYSANVVFETQCAHQAQKQIRKTIHLGTRLRKPSKAVAHPLDNHEGWYTREQKQVNPLAGSWCGIVQTGKEGREPALAYTRKPWETSLAGILRYLDNVYRCCQLMLGSKVASSK